MEKRPRRRKPEVTRQKLVDAAMVLMRRQGFAATTVDQICAEAGVTKGAFFHYFKSKDEIGGAAVEAWCRGRVEGYRSDLGDPEDDPLVRLNRMLGGLIESARQPPDGLLACLLGMVSQELGATHETMRKACSAALAGWTGFVASLLREAKETHPVRTDFDPEEIAWMLNGLWQGSLLVAKTRRDPDVVINNFRHARVYIEGLFAESAVCGDNHEPERRT